jgi:chemotaxis protein histidine kinase CheA
VSADPLVIKLIQDFWLEAQEHVESVTRDLLELEHAGEGSVSKEKYEAVARRLHTLKGSAATLGLRSLSELAHAMEEVLLPMRDQGTAVPRAVADALLEGLDTFLVSIKIAGAGEHDPATLPVDRALALLSSVLGSGSESKTTPEPMAAQPLEPRRRADDEVQNGAWRVDAVQLMALMRDVERVREVRLRVEERRRELRGVIDRLTNLEASDLGELRAALQGLDEGLRCDAEDTGDTVSSLEEGLKAICTLPARSMLEALPRAVRDVARQLDKRANLSIVGGDLSLDRRLLEALRGPLVHLVRNAVAHGIEAPLEREQLGKHGEGVVVVRVEQAGNRIFLSVEDDGRGIDNARVRAAAVRKSLVTPEQAESMSELELGELIFSPGFSTQDEVSESSGRGVGLDVVRRQVELLEGRLDVETRLGQGTRFVITLPMQLGSSPVLVVRAAEHTFGLPLLSLETGIALREAAILAGRSQARLDVGGELVPLHDLGVMLGLRGAWQPSRGQPLVIVHSGDRKIALAVDHVSSDVELVIRSLPVEVRAVPAFQGAALVALGELLLVLSPSWLVQQGHQRHEALPASRKRRALIVDDSLTARAMYRTILEAGGYSVQAASSREEALQQLVHGPFDVIMIDIVLGSDDGVALVRTLRTRSETRTTPLILISAQDTPTERQRGTTAGASLFLGKWECSSTRLLEAIDSLLDRRQAS